MALRYFSGFFPTQAAWTAAVDAALAEADRSVSIEYNADDGVWTIVIHTDEEKENGK